MFDEPMGVIAERCAEVWFIHQRLDQVLTNLIFVFPYCELVYAFDTSGQQISSNIRKASIDRLAYGQDLSSRPIAVSPSEQDVAQLNGAFMCDPYVSQVTRRPCATVMFAVKSDTAPLGFIAADFDPQDLLQI